MGQHWFGRLIIATWAGHIAIIGLLAPETMVGRYLMEGGLMGYLMAAALAVLAGTSLVDSAINDFLPARFTSALRNWRHMGFMAMAIVLTMLGAAIAVKTRVTLILPSFLLPALFAVVVTWLDMFSRHRGSKK